MANKPLIQWLAEQEGACCQYGYMRRFRNLTNKALASKLGVSERTVVDVRSMITEGGVCCREKPNCEFPSKES